MAPVVAEVQMLGTIQHRQEPPEGDMNGQIRRRW